MSWHLVLSLESRIEQIHFGILFYFIFLTVHLTENCLEISSICLALESHILFVMLILMMMMA